MSDYFQKRKLKNARKEYKCDLCGTKIELGEQYWRIWGKWEYGFFDTRLHKSCDALIDKYVDATHECEWDDDSVREWIAEEVCRDCVHGKDPDYYSFGDWEECEYPYTEVPSCPVVLKHFGIGGEKE